MYSAGVNARQLVCEEELSTLRSVGSSAVAAACMTEVLAEINVHLANLMTVIAYI